MKHFTTYLFNLLFFSLFISCQENDIYQPTLDNNEHMDRFIEKRNSTYNISLTTNRIESRDISCDPGDFDVLSCIQDVRIENQLINYEGCLLSVSYNQRVCFSLGEYEVSFWDLEIDYTDPSCSELGECLEDLQSSGDYIGFKDKIEAINVFASQQIELTQMALFVQFAIPSGCDDPLTAINASFFESDCETYCYQFDLFEGRSLQITSCGNLCCQRTTSYCINSEGDLEATLISKGSTTGNCNPPDDLDCIGLPSELSSPITCSNPCNRL